MFWFNGLMKQVPTEEDWGNYQADPDQEYSHGIFAGRTNEEMLTAFRDNVIERTEDLRWMPGVPFQYYMIGFKDFIKTGDFGHPCDAANSASCFIRLVLETLEAQPDHILRIMPDLFPTVDYVANHQAEYEADENIYGSFLEICKQIKSLYAALGG